MATSNENNFKDGLMKQVQKNVPYRRISPNALNNIDRVIDSLEMSELTRYEGELAQNICDKFFDPSDTNTFHKISDRFMCVRTVTLCPEDNINHAAIAKCARCKIMREFILGLKGRECEVTVEYRKEDLVEDPIPPLYFGEDIYDCYIIRVSFHL